MEERKQTKKSERVPLKRPRNQDETAVFRKSRGVLLESQAAVVGSACEAALFVRRFTHVLPTSRAHHHTAALGPEGCGPSVASAVAVSLQRVH